MNCVALIRQETKVIAGLGYGNMYIFEMEIIWMPQYRFWRPSVSSGELHDSYYEQCPYYWL
jgi:hypothetical protein